MKSMGLLIIVLVLTINIVSSNRLLQETICNCPAEYMTICCNGTDYSNICFAECNNCDRSQSLDIPC